MRDKFFGCESLKNCQIRNEEKIFGANLIFLPNKE